MEGIDSYWRTKLARVTAEVFFQVYSKKAQAYNQNEATQVPQNELLSIHPVERKPDSFTKTKLDVLKIKLLEMNQNPMMMIMQPPAYSEGSRLILPQRDPNYLSASEPSSMSKFYRLN